MDDKRGALFCVLFYIILFNYFMEIEFFMVDCFKKDVSFLFLLSILLLSLPCSAMEPEDFDKNIQKRTFEVPTDEEKPLDSSISLKYMRFLHNIYQKRDDLENTNTYFVLSNSHALFSLYYNSEDVLYRCLMVLPKITKYITPYLPQKIQHDFQNVLNEINTQLEIYSFCLYTKPYIFEKVFGCSSLLLMNLLPADNEKDSFLPYQKEIEAAVYYFSKAAGWYGSERIQSNLKSLWESSLSDGLTIDDTNKNVTETNCHKEAFERIRKCILNKDDSAILCLKKYKNNIIEYNDLKSVYENVTYIDSGSTNNVYAATINRPRGDLPAGSRIAFKTRIECKNSSFNTLIEDIEPYSKISLLRDYNGTQISDYYAQMYGIYFGPLYPSDWKYGQKCRQMRYTEMELMDRTIETYWNETILDNFVFELCLGEWASRKISNIYIADSHHKQLCLKNVSYYRSYHIGHKTYLFPPGISPKRIDLDDFLVLTKDDSMKRFDCLNIMQSYFSVYSQFGSNNIEIKTSGEGRSVLTEMTEHGIFNVFEKYFSKYIVSSKELYEIPSKEIKHFYVPDEYLDNT